MIETLNDWLASTASKLAGYTDLGAAYKWDWRLDNLWLLT